MRSTLVLLFAMSCMLAACPAPKNSVIMAKMTNIQDGWRGYGQEVTPDSGTVSVNVSEQTWIYVVQSSMVLDQAFAPAGVSPVKVPISTHGDGSKNPMFIIVTSRDARAVLSKYPAPDLCMICQTYTLGCCPPPR